MICPSMPIPEEFTELLYISYCKKITTPPFGAPLLAPGGICSLPPYRRHWPVDMTVVAYRLQNRYKTSLIGLAWAPWSYKRTNAVS